MTAQGKNNSPRKQIQDIYSLTALQEGMLFYNIAEDQTTSYVVQTVYELKGILNVSHLEQAIQLLNLRYDVLRTQILYKKISKPRQVVLREKATAYQKVDLSDMPEKERSEQFDAIVKENVSKGFHFDKDSLFRVILVKLEENHHKMIWCCHHIIMDGWSMSLLYQSFLKYYQELQKGVSIQQLQIEITEERKRAKEYKDYITWLNSQNMSDALSYWGDLLDGYENESKITPVCPVTEFSDVTE